LESATDLPFNFGQLELTDKELIWLIHLILSYGDTGTDGDGVECRWVMQNDRNIVIYDSNIVVVWESSTALVFCGDLFCDSISETHMNCPLDCYVIMCDPGEDSFLCWQIALNDLASMDHLG
jgi:hypothetical protein